MRDHRRVIAYLCKKRSIDYEIVKMLLQTGKLYQDKYGNCAFSVFDNTGALISAELHGTGDTRFKGQTSARQGFGFELLHLLSWRSPLTVCYFESAIDLLSFYQIYMRYPIYDYLLISMSGLSPSVVRNYVSMYPDAEHLLFVDHDQAGQKFALDMRMRVKYPPVGKDWNEYLQSKLKSE